MGLGRTDTHNPVVKIDVMAGSQELKSDLLERTLMKFQYVSRQGKGQVPKITMEFDNSSGLVFNPLILAVGLKLGVRFGYRGNMSKTFIAPVKSVKANCLVDPGRDPKSPRPDTYGTVVMEMHLHKGLTHLKPSADQYLAAGPKRISAVMRELARYAGYREDQIFIQEGLGMVDSNGPKEETVDLAQIPEGETLLQYMRKRAVERGFYLSVTDSEFRFHRPDWKLAPRDTISYFMGPDVLNFSVEGDYALNTGKVTGKAYDPLKGILAQYVVDAKTGVPIGAFGFTPLKPSGVRAATADTPPDIVNPEDFVTTISSKLIEKTTKRLYNAASSRWAIKLTVVGNPVIFEQDGILLDNFGPVVDGLWVVREVEHRIDQDGYTTLLTLKGKPKGPGAGGPIWPVYVLDAKTGIPIGAYAELGGNWTRDKKGYIHMKKNKKNKGKRKGYSRPGKALFAQGRAQSQMSAGKPH